MNRTRPMTRFTLALAAAAVGMASALMLSVGPIRAAGPDRVLFPKDYAKDFALYSVIDRFDQKRARFMYINKPALAAAKAGAPLPDGVVVVMEVREIELDAAGDPVLDDKGRMKPTPITASAVQEKRKGWGEAIPADIRNADWDYAAFKADGSANAEVKLEPCFTCHLTRKDRDFTFTTFTTIADGFRP